MKNHSSDFGEQIKSMRIGISFAVLTVLYGFSLGVIFGAFEDNIKAHLEHSGKAVFDTVYEGQEAKLRAVTSKCWTYFKRAHLHANGIGTTALALSLLLLYVPVAGRLKAILSGALGIGALGYSSFWMFSALKAPGMGSTGAAKESLTLLAVPSAFLCTASVFAVLGLFAFKLFGKK